MNILVHTCQGRCIARPDSTLNKNGDDFYVPDAVRDLLYTPVVFARTGRSAKAVEEKFAQRYLDAVGFGLLLYPVGESGPSLAEDSVWDHSSLLPLPLYNKMTFEGEDNVFRILRDEKEIFSCPMKGIEEKIISALVSCTAKTYARTGDYVVAELAPAAAICAPKTAICHIIAQFCGNEVMNFEIKY